MQELQLAGIDVSAQQLLVQVRNPQGDVQQLDLPTPSWPSASSVSS